MPTPSTEDSNPSIKLEAALAGWIKPFNGYFFFPVSPCSKRIHVDALFYVEPVLTVHRQ